MKKPLQNAVANMLLTAAQEMALQIITLSDDCIEMFNSYKTTGRTTDGRFTFSIRVSQNPQRRKRRKS